MKITTSLRTVIGLGEKLPYSIVLSNQTFILTK